MNELSNIKGILFDYGGTLDTNGLHWAEVFWKRYTAHQVPVSKKQFKEAYIHAERSLALHPLIQPTYNFLEVLEIKLGIQIDYLIEQSHLKDTPLARSYATKIANECYLFVKKNLIPVQKLLTRLSKQYKLALVSNFYGNLTCILKDFDLLCHFSTVIESAVVGVRKPNPEIFALGVKSLQLAPDETVVVGDSFSKDILPAISTGCHTIWLKGEGWAEETDDTVPDVIIKDIVELENLL